MLDHWTAFYNLMPTLPTIQSATDITGGQMTRYNQMIKPIHQKVCKDPPFITLITTPVWQMFTFLWAC